MQSESFESICSSNGNLVISAPTAAGKTVLLELGIVRNFTIDAQSPQKARVVYLAPTKSLCSEKIRDWKSSFELKKGLKVMECTGDSDINWRQLGEASIIVTTPEKWDSLTRRWKERKELVASI